MIQPLMMIAQAVIQVVIQVATEVMVAIVGVPVVLADGRL